MLQKIISQEKIISMISELQTNLTDYIAKENSANIAEELAELLFYLITTGAPELKKNKNEWAQITGNVDKISSMKPKSLPSISNKTIFKHIIVIRS